MLHIDTRAAKVRSPYFLTWRKAMRALAKITAKGQTTIPREIRQVLKVGPGDTLLWELGAQGEVVVRQVQPMDVAYLGALEGTLSEWSGAADEEAYRDL